jgi:CheY-like chemotaxis protein
VETLGIGRRVLVVEDNPDVREALHLWLEIHGHRVESAGDAAEAMAKALAFEPEIALIDLGLPDVDGFEVARHLQAVPMSRKIRLVALTGRGQPADRARARQAGFDAHLVKPVDLDALAGLLRSPGSGADC